MRIELAISLRYLRAPRAGATLSYLTAIALVGVALGVAALVVAMAVMNGYQANLIRAMAGSLPHLSLYPIKKGGFRDAQELISDLKSRYRPVSVSRFAMQEGLVQGPGGVAGSIHGVMLRGVDPAVEGTVEEFLSLVHGDDAEWEALTPPQRIARSRQLVEGLAAEPAPGVFPVLLSRTLAENLGVKPGDRLVPMRFPKEGAGFSPQPAPQQLQMAGYFDSGIPVFDELVLLTHLDHVAMVFPDRPVEVGVGVRLADPLEVTRVAAELRRGPLADAHSFYVYSWLESNRGLFQVIRFQKVMLYVAMMAIVVIAFFGMISTLTVLVSEKAKEIAVLKSLGATDRTILAVFFIQGALIGLVGTALGVGLGLLVGAGLDAFPLIEIPPGVYPGTDKIPVLVSATDLLLVVGGALTVCMAAPILPARQAMALQPAEALRYE